MAYFFPLRHRTPSHSPTPDLSHHIVILLCRFIQGKVMTLYTTFIGFCFASVIMVFRCYSQAFIRHKAICKSRIPQQKWLGQRGRAFDYFDSY